MSEFDVDGDIEAPASCNVIIEIEDPISEGTKIATEAVTALSGVLGIASGPAAAQAVRLSLALAPCILQERDNNSLPWMLHPTQMADPYYESEYAGCILGNAMIVIGFGVVCYSIILVLTKLMPGRFEDYMETSRMLKFPSVPLFVFLFLYQGTVLSVFKLIFYPGSEGRHYAISVPGFILCVAVPVQLQRIISREVEDNKMARYRIDDVILPKWLLFIVGPGEWVSTTKKNAFVQKYSTMIRPYKDTRSWYVVFEFVCMALLGAAMTLRTTTWQECGHVRVFSASVNFFFFIFEFATKPHVRGRDCFTDPALFILQSMGLLLVGLGYYNEDLDYWTFEAAMPFFHACSALLTIKLILDLICLIWVLFLFQDPNKTGSWKRSSRRQRLQNDEFREEKKNIVELNDFDTEEGSDITTLFEASAEKRGTSSADQHDTKESLMRGLTLPLLKSKSMNDSSESTNETRPDSSKGSKPFFDPIESGTGYVVLSLCGIMGKKKKKKN